MQNSFIYYKFVEEYILKYLNIIPEKDKYSHNDGYIETENIITLYEFKSRNFNSNKFTTHFLEVKKLLNLIKKAKEIHKTTNKKIRIIYLNLFTDNVLYYYNLKPIYLIYKDKDKTPTDLFKISNIKAKKVTANNKQDRIYKEFIELYPEKATKKIIIKNV